MALNFPSAPNTNATYSFSGKTWTYNGNAWNVTSATLSTSVVPEGSNLYFSNARVYSNVVTLGYATNSNVALKANVVDLTTANVTEVTNLYFTNARVYSNVTQLGYITTSALSGYATNAQLATYATNAQLASYATNAQLTSYATTTNVALKANIVDLNTSNITEGTNLYYTNARVNTALLSTGNIIPSGNNIQTLGNTTNRFKDLFLSGNTIYLGNLVLQSTTSTLQIADNGGNVIFNAVDGSGFATSTVFAFPGSVSTSDYGDLTASTDAFGVSTSSVYNCMEPTGRSITADLGTL